MSKRMLAMIAVFLFVGTLVMQAGTITVNFYQGPDGSIGTTATSGPNGAQINVNGWYYDPGAGLWKSANLWNRNDGLPEQGLGICSPAETRCASTGEQNELSNEVRQELIGLSSPTGYRWVSFTLGSLDNNDGGEHERGILYGTTTGNPNSTSILYECHFGTGGEIAPGDACSIGNSFNPSLVITAGQNSPFMFFQAYD